MREQTAIFSESFPIDRLVSLHPKFKRTEVAAFLGNFKLISSTAGKRELYDLIADPKEKKNLFNPDDDVPKELEMRLSDWLESLEFKDKQADKPYKLDRNTLDRLKSLGYVK